MTDIWDKLKESVNFYNAEGFIPRRDIRNTIADLVDEGDKLKEKAEKLEAVKTHLTKWKSGHSDWQMGRMSQWKEELVQILGESQT